MPRPSLVPCQPYSLCISNTRLTAALFCTMPISSSRVRKVLPVPLLPKMPLERLTSSGRLRQSLVSMSRGLPMWKLSLSSEPKTRPMSASVARYTLEKWLGTVFTGIGPVTPPTGVPRVR